MKRRLIELVEPQWAFVRRIVIPDIKEPEKDYLVRWKLISTPWFGIYLHKVLLPDRDRMMHDHPWKFKSLILKGGYIEHWRFWSDRFTGAVHAVNKYKFGSVNSIGLYDFHSIKELLRVPTWTLVFVGRRQKDWGYDTPDGWVSHTKYNWTTYNGYENA